MRTIMIAALFFTVTAMNAQTTWVVDKAHSNVTFTVSHLVISEVDGRFRVYSGSLSSPDPDFSDARVEFAVDVVLAHRDVRPAVIPDVLRIHLQRGAVGIGRRQRNESPQLGMHNEDIPSERRIRLE